MFRYGHFGFHHGPGPFAWILLALFLAALVLAVVAVVRLWRHPGVQGPTARTFAPGPPPAMPVDPALTELRVRYARGEISWDEFAQRSANLGYGAGPTPPAHPAPPPGG